MRGPALFCLLLLVAPLLTHALVMRLLFPNLTAVNDCATRKGVFNTVAGNCAAGKLGEAYWKMYWANCKNCDKYFHCTGNYNAVHQCTNSAQASRAAEAISDCREEVDNGGEDSALDQQANRAGRRGENCSALYLEAVKCFYHPKNGTCIRPTP
uniref:Putative conserved secreted protein synganglion overexpressed n=1 Tax=Rhipicephalus microplus TaxID=6941 RepID=A0A6M2CS54_RHIMP